MSYIFPHSKFLKAKRYNRGTHGKPLKETKQPEFKIFGLHFRVWKVTQGYRLSVDAKNTRYIFKPFWFEDKCSISQLV